MAVNPAGPEFRVNTFTRGTQRTYLQSPQSVAMDADGDFVVTWSSYGQDGDGFGVYAQRYVVNEAPTTSGISNVTVAEDAPNTVIDLFAAFADDTDTDAQLTYTIRNNSNPSLFSATTIDPVTGQLTLDYAANANGTGNITVRATDTGDLFVETTFGVTVNAINDAPVAVNDAYSTNEDTVLTIAAPGVLANDTDVDGDTLT